MESVVSVSGSVSRVTTALPQSGTLWLAVFLSPAVFVAAGIVTWWVVRRSLLRRS